MGAVGLGVDDVNAVRNDNGNNAVGLVVSAINIDDGNDCKLNWSISIRFPNGSVHK